MHPFINHYMRTLLVFLLIACFFQYSTSFAQTAEKALIHIDGYPCLGVTKNEKLLIATRIGEVAFADSIKGFWQKLKVNPQSGFLLNSALLDNVCFFNADTAFVAGYISNKDQHNIIYHTIDGGKSWKPIEFGLDGYVNDAAFLDNGEAWLGVGEKGIAYTSNYGFTWTSFSFPNKKEGFTRIYFNKKREGIIGSLWNEMAYTRDNCNTWISIPTPLSQKKYNKTIIGTRPQINGVAIFNDYLLVKQEELVFYSKKDTVNWILMRGYTDFYTDSENSALFFKTSKGDFVKCDSRLQVVSTCNNISNSFTATCRNGSLFILGDKRLWQINAGNKLIETPIYTNDVTDLKPQIFRYALSGNWGNRGSKVYKQQGTNGPWEYAFTLPFATDSGYLSMKDTANILFSRRDDSLFYYSISDAKVKRTTKKEMMESFCANGIKKIIFSKGSQGCFHNVSSELVYEIEDGRFVLSGKIDKGGGHSNYLKDNDDEIDQQVVEEFVKKIPAIYKKRATINDLEFTQKDYDACKRNIMAYKTYLENKGSAKNAKEKGCAFIFWVNNLDFSKLISLVDSVKTVDQNVLNDALLSSEFWSTTSFSAKIKLVNTNNEVLEIKSIYYEANAFYFPWSMELNGVVSTNTAIEINRFLKDVFPNFLDSSNKVDLIQNIVKELYRRQE